MLGSVADDTLLLLKGTLAYLMQVCLTIPTVWMMTNLFGRWRNTLVSVNKFGIAFNTRFAS